MKVLTCTAARRRLHDFHDEELSVGEQIAVAFGERGLECRSRAREGPAHPLGARYGGGMITRLAGMLEAVEGIEATVRLEGGVWRQVLVPVYLADALRERVGSAVTLHTLEYLESQGQGSSYIPRLIGFGSAQERRFFELLLTLR